jgi:heme-degrading monooxygenase HmoA
MILRLWSGFTTPAMAPDYDRILNTDVAPGIVAREMAGLERFEVWRRLTTEESTEREFLTAMWFKDQDAVARFTGGDPRSSVVPPQARAVLKRFDEHSRHYELRHRHWPLGDAPED